MGKLNLTVNLDNLTEKEREKFFELVEKSKEKKSFNPFERVEDGEDYYAVIYNGEVNNYTDIRNDGDKGYFGCHNYYNNEEFAERQALRELLNRKLIKFSYENDGADIVYSNSYHIFYNPQFEKFTVDKPLCPDLLTPLFISEEVAQRAIDEVIKPFMEEHPNFKWWG